jgi:hypothetical protein
MSQLLEGFVPVPYPSIAATSTAPVEVDFRHNGGYTARVYIKNLDATNSVKVIFSAVEAGKGTAPVYYVRIPAGESRDWPIKVGRLWLLGVGGTVNVELLGMLCAGSIPD